MSNEQRAHDLAIMLTEFYLNNPDKAQGEIPNISPRENHLVDDPYSVYKYFYNKTAKYIDEDFNE